MSADADKEPLTCKNMQAEKSLTLTHVLPKHTEARTTNDTTMTERTGWGEGGGGKPHVEKDKAGQTTSQDRRDEPIVTKVQKDTSNDDEEGEGEEQSKRKRKGESAEFSFGAEKECRAKLDAESDEASGDDDNADFMKVNDEQPIEEFCKASTPTVSAYKKFESLYSVIRGLVAANEKRQFRPSWRRDSRKVKRLYESTGECPLPTAAHLDVRSNVGQGARHQPNWYVVWN